MEAEKTYRNKVARIIQQKRGGKSALEFADNRQNRMLQALAEPVQRLEDEDEMLQGKFENPVQREEDEAELLQGKFEQPAQRLGDEEDDELMQGKFETPEQKRNETGMSDNLKAGIEDLSGALQLSGTGYGTGISLHTRNGYLCRSRTGTAPAARGMACCAADGRACRAYHRSERIAGERLYRTRTRGRCDGCESEQLLKFRGYERVCFDA